MFDLFKQLQAFLKFDDVWIDNNIFRLHYKGTVILFVMCSIVVTSRQYIGDPIDCIVEGVGGSTMDTYCWIHSTFSIPSRFVIEFLRLMQVLTGACLAIGGLERKELTSLILESRLWLMLNLEPRPSITSTTSGSASFSSSKLPCSTSQDTCGSRPREARSACSFKD